LLELTPNTYIELLHQTVAAYFPAEKLGVIAAVPERVGLTDATT
jgi:hypothetical protein